MKILLWSSETFYHDRVNKLILNDPLQIESLGLENEPRVNILRNCNL